MKILVLNCGSSSIKYQLFDMDNDSEVLAKGLLERIGIDNSELKHQSKDKEPYKVVQDVPDHQVGIDLIFEALLHKEHGAIKNIKEIVAVGHRVVHGGEKFCTSVKITDEIIAEVEDCSELAPLHNPANLKGIYAIKKVLPDVPQCAVFDTAFHQTMKPHAFLYPLPYKLYEEDKIRRYGFHGSSHRYVSHKACEFVGLKFDEQKVITAHLGSGASIAAIKNGKSVDTSMGFTPVEGLMMGTRVGDMDLGVLLYLMEKKNLSLKKASNLINKESGVRGVSEVSSDMRDVWAALATGNNKARLALEMYAYRVKKYIGAYAAAMGGLDVLVFTGGVGENDFGIRKMSCEGLEYMGIDFDTLANDKLRGKNAIISKPASQVKVVCYATNEELVIAHDTYEIIQTIVSVCP